MTVAVSLKVHEGVVLAADSAATLSSFNQQGELVDVSVYNNANKIVNLVKGLPLGVVVWGAGSIGEESISSILKDLRLALSGDPRSPTEPGEWKINVEDYTVQEIAVKVRRFVFEERYQPQLGDRADAPALGMIVAGYSSKASHAEEYKVEMDVAGCPSPTLLRSGPTCGLTAGGQPSAITRLVSGIDPALGSIMEQGLGVSAEQVGPALQLIVDHLRVPLVQDPMPFADALDLAEFLVDVTVRFSRFTPGPETVGGPIELAGITKHEGFKWIKRKHYYSNQLNPAGGLAT